MMEMGALALGSGAVVGGVFGMNLVSGLEEHPQGETSKAILNNLETPRSIVVVYAYYFLSVPTYPAFLTVLGGMGLMMGGIFTGFSMKYRLRIKDTFSQYNYVHRHIRQ